MSRHIGALGVCTLAAIVVCSIAGELIAPSRALSPLPSLLTFSVLSAICAPIVYIITALVVRAAQKKEGIEVLAARVSFFVTLAASVAFALHARTA
jgi:hypothetical protein